MTHASWLHGLTKRTLGAQHGSAHTHNVWVDFTYRPFCTTWSAMGVLTWGAWDHGQGEHVRRGLKAVYVKEGMSKKEKNLHGAVYTTTATSLLFALLLVNGCECLQNQCCN